MLRRPQSNMLCASKLAQYGRREQRCPICMSLISLSLVLAWTWRCHILKRLPSTLYLIYTPSSSSRLSAAYLWIMLWKMLKIVGARELPCFAPIVMGIGNDRSPLSLIWMFWFMCRWITVCKNWKGKQVDSV